MLHTGTPWLMTDSPGVLATSNAVLMTSAPCGYVTAFWVLRNWPVFTTVCNIPCTHMTVFYIFAKNWHLLFVSAKPAHSEQLICLMTTALDQQQESWVIGMTVGCYKVEGYLCIFILKFLHLIYLFCRKLIPAQYGENKERLKHTFSPLHCYSQISMPQWY